MDTIKQTDNSAITVLSNMQCLIDVMKQFPQDKEYNEVVFKSGDDFYRHIYHIDVRSQDIVFSHNNSPVIMFIPSYYMENIFKDATIYDLSTVETDQLLLELKKYIKLEETIQYQIEKQTDMNAIYIKHCEMAHLITEERRIIRSSIKKFIDYLINDKICIEPKDNDIFKLYRNTNNDNKKYIIYKIVNSYSPSHMYLNSQLKKILDETDNDFEIYKELWFRYYH